MYVIRNEQGTMIAKLPPNELDKLFMSRIGEWKTKRFESGEVRNCFVIKERGGWIPSPNNMILYLWEGYYLHGED